MLSTKVDDDWLGSQKAILGEAGCLPETLPLISTVALSSDVTRDQTQIALLLEATEKWKPAGYYIVCEHPDGYLVEDPNWLANVLDLIAGLRLQGKEVIVGYANHQLLLAAAAKATAICSGTWMNVRSFPPQKFQSAIEEEIRKRAKWYYCPQSLSEYKLPFLDIAHRQGLLETLRTPDELDGGFVSMLFSGAQPSATDFSEQAAFRHYLHSLYMQVKFASAATFDETLEVHEKALDSAETIQQVLAAAGVRGQQRDFSDIVDVNRSAMSVLSSTRGAMLRRRWSNV